MRLEAPALQRLLWLAVLSACSVSTVDTGARGSTVGSPAGSAVGALSSGTSGTTTPTSVCPAGLTPEEALDDGGTTFARLCAHEHDGWLTGGFYRSVPALDGSRCLAYFEIDSAAPAPPPPAGYSGTLFDFGFDVTWWPIPDIQPESVECAERLEYFGATEPPRELAIGIRTGPAPMLWGAYASTTGGPATWLQHGYAGYLGFTGSMEEQADGSWAIGASW